MKMLPTLRKTAGGTGEKANGQGQQGERETKKVCTTVFIKTMTFTDIF